MPFISYVDPARLEGEAKEIYERAEAKSGRVTNMVKTLLHSVPAFRALEFYPVRDVLAKRLGLRAVYFFCYAISTEDECIICSTYHARLLKSIGIRPEEFEFTEEEKVLVQYGRALAHNANRIDPSIYAELKRLFTEDEIVLITAVGCRMIASNLFNSALKIPLDDYLEKVDFDSAILEKAY